MGRIFKIEKENNNNTFKLCVLVMFFLLVGSSIFAQESRFEISSIEVLNGSNDAVAPVKVSTSELNSNMNFILWFMGTKEDVNSTKSGVRFILKKVF